MTNIAFAHEVIEFWIAEYSSREDALDELGSLDELAIKVEESMERQNLSNNDEIFYVAHMVELDLF